MTEKPNNALTRRRTPVTNPAVLLNKINNLGAEAPAPELTLAAWMALGSDMPLFYATARDYLRRSWPALAGQLDRMAREAYPDWRG